MLFGCAKRGLTVDKIRVKVSNTASDYSCNFGLHLDYKLRFKGYVSHLIRRGFSNGVTEMKTLKTITGDMGRSRNSSHNTVYEDDTTILEGPRRQNDRRSMDEVGKG
ncbi:hypothetical protein Trydic_g1173 [Trypoxylus dichotomus]